MTTIGRYQILEKLGQGGMGVVYRAFDTLIERVVALKIISAPIEGNPEARERFIREARAAGQLSHPNIITIHDLGEHEGQPYLAMEFLEGEDLQTRMGRPEKMSLGRKVELAMNICYGLEYAHARGVIHRDIKPANIYITDNGAVKILDFGLARLLTSELTSSHMLMGTVNYMAPEQIRGERADHRADIFSVGVVFYELLSGRKAFAGDSFASTLFKILNEVPEALPNIDASLPLELVAVVERSLAKPRDERYQNMGELLRDLTVCRQQLGLLDSAAGRPGSGGHRPTSDPWSRPSGQGSVDRPGTPAPAPLVTPMPTPAPSAPPAISRVVQGTIAAAVFATLFVGAWLLFARPERTSSGSEPAAPTAPRTSAAPDVSSALRRALDAFQKGDFQAADRFAGEVLAAVPDHAEARRVQTQAREAAAAVERGLKQARTHFESGRFTEASKAAGEVLSVAPANEEARRIMEEGATRSRGDGAEEARSRMIRARSSARAANAPALASGSYRAASDAEREAQRLFQAGRLVDATAKFYEASGLFRSSEIAAETNAAAEAERKRQAQIAAEREREQERERERRAQTAEQTPPVSTGTPLPALPPASSPGTLPPPAPPAPAPPAPAPQADPPRAPAAEEAIRDLLDRYKAALEARSLDALKRLWPSLGGQQQAAIQNEFSHASRIDVDIVDPRIVVSGSSATVAFIRRYELVTVDGQRLNNDTRTTMTLHRSNGAWVIEAIRFDAPRRG
jgi:eukaryotic-like serine/threonine-protein kinase